MNVRICDLPEDTRQLAIEEAKRRNNTHWMRNGEEVNLLSAFVWGNSPQGFTFWDNIDRSMRFPQMEVQHEEDDQIIK